MTFFICILGSHGKMTWPNRFYHRLISDSTFGPFANMMILTSFVSRIWFDALESTYHTLFDFEVFTFIELALCFITKARHSAIFDDYLRHYDMIWVCQNWSTSSSTCSLCGPFSHSTRFPYRPLFACFQCHLDSTYF